MDDTGDVAAGCGGLDERVNRLTRGHVDGRCAHLEPSVAQHLSRRIAIALVQVGQQDVLAKADPPGDCLTGLPGSDDKMTSPMTISFICLVSMSGRGAISAGRGL